MQPQNTSAKKMQKTSKQKCKKNANKNATLKKNANKNAKKMQIACFSFFFAFFGGGFVWASNFSKIAKNLGKMQK